MVLEKVSTDQDKGTDRRIHRGMLAHFRDELIMDWNFQRLLRAQYILDHVPLYVNGNARDSSFSRASKILCVVIKGKDTDRRN